MFIRIFIATLFSLCLLSPKLTFAQGDSSLVQFSGLVLDGTTDRLYPLPFVTVSLKGTKRGTYSNYKGFFSIVAEKGDVVVFSSIGYKTIEYKIPDTLQSSRYTVVQLMSADTVNLPETVIFPWPSREHFKEEFLAMDVTKEMEGRAQVNLAQQRIAQLAVNMSMDGNENSDYFLRREAQKFYYVGQAAPMNIFNPMKWAEFFDAWKSGKFKKQK